MTTLFCFICLFFLEGAWGLTVLNNCGIEFFFLRLFFSVFFLMCGFAVSSSHAVCSFSSFWLTAFAIPSRYWGTIHLRPNAGLQGGKTFCASLCASLIAGSRRAFLCVDCVCLLLEFWVKCTRCECLLPVKHFYLTCLLFSSLENYFGFRTTYVKGKTDHSVSLRWNKGSWTFLKRRVFFWLCIRLIYELISPSRIKTHLYSVISSYGYFFYMPRFITFAEPALSLSSVKEPYCCYNAPEWTNLFAY